MKEEAPQGISTEDLDTGFHQEIQIEPGTQFELIESQGHLKEGVPGITTRIGRFLEFRRSIQGFSKEDRPLEVVWGGSGDVPIMNAEKIKHAGEATYSISPIDNRNKFTGSLGPCIGVVLVGRSVENNEELSCLAHLELSNILIYAREEFQKHWRRTCKEMGQRCEQGTIDAVTFGGAIYDGKIMTFEGEYNAALDLCGNTTEETLGIRPTVATVPKNNLKSADDAFFINETRELFVERVTV